MPGDGPAAGLEIAETSDEISDLLPLRLARPRLIPPAPTRCEAAVDFLPDFGGASWVAYGAAHLLIVSHFPSPDSRHDDPLVGPFFQQAIESPLQDAPLAHVTAVAWCPIRPSEGELAAARGDCVWLYAPTPGDEPGSFCWRQTAVMLQFFIVKDIGWTGSGDGLIVAGIEVVLWIRKNTCWEAAWKSRAEVPQSLVSANWFAERPIATAAGICTEDCPPQSREESSCVLVHQQDGKSGITRVRLCHPRPVSMIQWRPHNLTCIKNNDSYPLRDVLLTCCLDGSVRLWSEVDNGRARRSSKDVHDQKNLSLSFHVIAVIEMNQCLKGTLGTDISIAWAIEFGGIISKSKGTGHVSLFEGNDHDKVGRCAWLISVGPMSSIAFWAIHCLDDIFPLRFPRVMMWKNQDLKDFKEYTFCNSISSNFNDRPILVKAVVARSWLFGPPVVCSLLQLLPNNSFCWSQLSNSTMSDLEVKSLSQSSKEKCLSCFTSAVLYQDGHTGKIVQLAVHPYSCEIELAASLDSNGFLLFWSLPTTYNCTLGMQMFVNPAWKLLGKIILQDLSPDVKYSCLKWVPLVLDEKCFLLLGNGDGVDCFMINISGKEGNIVCQKILMVSFSGQNHVGGPPDQIFATSIDSTSGPALDCNGFFLFAIWMKKFQALSWKVLLCSESPSQSNSQCDFDAQNVPNMKKEGLVSSFTGRMYEAAADLVSSTFPNSLDVCQVTSVAVVSFDNSVLFTRAQHFMGSLNEVSVKSFPYHLATGCSDGTLKLWRISHSETTGNYDLKFHWELVGAFTAHQSPVSAVSLSSCGGRVATTSMGVRNNITSLHIWESICLIGGGGFLLEDAMSFDEAVVGLSWLSIGNGQLLLGVCMPNELRVYSERSFTNKNPAKSSKSREMHIWCCIALSPLTCPVPQDFLWGPRAALVLVYEKHFSLFSPWSFRSQKEYHEGHTATIVDGADHSFSCAIYHARGPWDTKESVKDENVKENGCNASTLHLKMLRQQYEFDTKSGLYSMLDIANRLCGILPVYHPDALIQYLHTGKWKRAYLVLKHLVGYIKSTGISAANLERNKSQKSFCGIPEVHLSAYFEENISKDLCSKGFQWGQDTANGASSLQYQQSFNQFAEGNSIAAMPENASTITPLKSEIMGFVDVLEKSGDIVCMNDIDKNQITAIVELLGEISDSCYTSTYESLDEPGRRFWVAVQFQRLYFLRKFGRFAAAEEFIVNSGLVALAFQSDCQDNLLSAISSAEPSWVEMRNLGVGFWFTSTTQLRARMEKLARSQYLKRKDPKDCALLYLALNRVQVLAGLFKVSMDEKDKVLFGFLSRNFQEEKNKAAALKNAYVLMGRHQLELAIAFFLLGGDMSSAVTVCAKNLGDEQLALVICRLLEGYGGPLERQLISNFLLPNAIGKRDYWLSSLLEWTLGNYSRSLKHLFDSHVECMIDQSATLCCRAAFSDPNIGQYCVILASKNCLRNLIGDFLATVVSKFALLMTMKALNRCGLPLEALEYISSFSIEGKDQCSMFDIESHEIFHDFLNPFSHGGCNWLLGSVACHLELNVKSNMALLYIGKLLSYHPCHPHATFASFGEPTIHDEDVSCQEEVQIEEFNSNLNMTVSMFEQKFLLKSIDLAEMIVVFACNKGLQFLGYVWFQDYIHRDHDTDGHSVNSYMFNSAISSLVLKASKEISHMVARFVVSCSFTDTTLKLSSSGSLSLEKDCYNSRDFCLRSVVYSLRTLRPLFKLYKNGSFPEGLTWRTSDILVFLEYFIYFASTWLMGNLKGLIIMIYPILNLANDRSTFEVIAGELMKLLRQNSDLIVHDASGDVTWRFSDSNPKEGQDGQSGSVVLSIPDVEKWHLIKTCLWMHFSSFAKHQLSKFLVTDRHENENGEMDLMILFPMLLTRLLMASFTYVSSSLIHQLASYLRQKALKGLPVPALCWLKEASQSPRSLHSNHAVDSLGISGNEDIEFMLKILWEISVCPQEICANFVYERINCFSCNGQPLPQSWQDIQKGMFSGHENNMSLSNERDGTINGSSPNDAADSLPRSGVSDTYGFIVTRGKDARLRRDIFSFHNPKEVFRRSGELVEAICFNSINEQQVALVSNRKGLLFFDLKIEEPSRKNSGYIWPVSDWPQDGWAGCESTPIPTFVSPGIGLGSKSGVHLGLGGATIGLGSLARPGRDLTGGGAFGIPGYAGIGASGLGWGEQEEFKYMDLPATVENIRSRALSHHPSKPLFLVGSSNTHIYLWEFGKDRATATYGILPAANVSPPYALTSVSALQFDHCGQRFATAALDGTVCAWQLEVGGRSNVHPTESNLCFSNHAADVAYLATGGSILAAAGCSSNDVNVVVWDTLAPPDTSQASLVCHEGGARSLSVFDNDIGSSSISPLIVTGGKNGDVGLHDFRFIATGRTKHHRHSSNHDLKSFGVNDTTLGTFKSAENVNGMIWYIPKAHLGSITKISTIPNTCLFLTGSKDGDVKLWDAKRCELIFHWQKMHDRHTFLQPNSRGFGGVVRAAVTDIQVLSHGFLTCGGDGLVKLVSLR